MLSGERSLVDIHIKIPGRRRMSRFRAHTAAIESSPTMCGPAGERVRVPGGGGGGVCGGRRVGVGVGGGGGGGWREGGE